MFDLICSTADFAPLAFALLVFDLDFPVSRFGFPVFDFGLPTFDFDHPVFDFGHPIFDWNSPIFHPAVSIPVLFSAIVRLTLAIPYMDVPIPASDRHDFSLIPESDMDLLPFVLSQEHHLRSVLSAGSIQKSS